MKKFIKRISKTFSIWTAILLFGVYFFLNAGYFYLISKQMFVSIVMGLYGGGLLFYMSMESKRLKKYQFLLRQLNQYATSVTFFLKTGKNVPDALEASKEGLSPSIKRDIQKTIDCLNAEGVVNTDSFRKYNFPSLDVYHKILAIRYSKGGNVKEMFRKPNKNIHQEIVRRDSLFRRKRIKNRTINVINFIAAAIPLFMYFVIPTLYEQFLSNKGVAMMLLVGYFMVLITNMALTQREKNNISARL